MKFARAIASLMGLAVATGAADKPALLRGAVSKGITELDRARLVATSNDVALSIKLEVSTVGELKTALASHRGSRELSAVKDVKRATIVLTDICSGLN